MNTYHPVPRLFGDDFRERPHEAYDRLRAAGPVAWAEIAEGVHALVVTSWATARALLADPDFSRDPAHWTAVADNRIPAELAYMVIPGVQRAEGRVHERLRRALEECLAGIDAHETRARVQRDSRLLIQRFAARGHADLMREYAEPVVALAFAELLGCPPETADPLRDAVHALTAAEPDATLGWTDLAGILRDTIRTKKKTPGTDLTSFLLAHPAALSDEETVGQLASLIVLGAAPTAAWIGSTLHALLTEPAYASRLVGGAVTLRTALNETLSVRCPVANSSVHYARRPKTVHGVRVPQGVPVLISHAATGLDPDRPGRGDALDRSHLAWSAGIHRCPAPGLATSIAEAAIENAVDALWDLSAPISTVAGKHGPFMHCPAHVGVFFSPPQEHGLEGEQLEDEQGVRTRRSGMNTPGRVL
ncbi:cytochrome P450 [Streptomyces prunicolor]|uniref:cytochrome P450 n=1 Tax=Streptomyces prunicolor TaxID=67348 RepID=UPI0034238866